MIIDEVTLENFGLYAGVQTIVLTPVSAERPITLISGLNGRGKTTLLDAIQLCFYGKFADCSNRGNLAYPVYLQQSIHKGNRAESAAVGLTFRHLIDGKEVVYQLRRSWHKTESLQVEKFHVVKDGIKDVFLSDNWSEVVEGILPRRIANFFFFDGEKIAHYAAPENATELLKTAMSNLLGMDLVDQLANDLDIIKNRKSKDISDAELRSEFETAQAAFDDLQSKHRVLSEGISQLKTHRLDFLTKQNDQIEQRFRKAGGEFYERRQEIDAELVSQNAKHRESLTEVRAIAAEETPLMLVQPLIKRALERARLEETAVIELSLVDSIQKRDAKILKALAKFPSTNKAAKAISQIMSDDIKARRAAGREGQIFGQERTGFLQSGAALEKTFGVLSKAARTALDRLDEITDQLTHLESQNSSVPDEEVVKDILAERAKVRSEIEVVKTAIASKEEEREKISVNLTRARQSLSKIAEDRVRAEFASEDALRIIDHATRVQATLRKLKEKAITQHINRIERSIHSSFRSLLGKPDLVEGVQISPENFAVHLRDRDGNVTRLDRLSAAERQLFAVSMLWGLATAAGRQLPTVIDTPLGRLDSKHRENLVTSYFPRASHQVILLSTDTEISGDYLDKLTPAIGRTYVLQYDSSTQSTTARSGKTPLEVQHAA